MQLVPKVGQGGSGGILAGLPGGVPPNVPQFPLFLQPGSVVPGLGALSPGPAQPFNFGALGYALPLPLGVVDKLVGAFLVK